MVMGIYKPGFLNAGGSCFVLLPPNWMLAINESKLILVAFQPFFTKMYTNQGYTSVYLAVKKNGGCSYLTRVYTEKPGERKVYEKDSQWNRREKRFQHFVSNSSYKRLQKCRKNPGTFCHVKHRLVKDDNK